MLDRAVLPRHGDRPTMLSQPPAATLDPRLDDAKGIGTRGDAPAAEAGWSPPIDGHGLFKSLMGRLPRRVRRSFDHEQLLALRQAAEEMAWGEHPIDIRLSLPLPGARRYLVLVGGRERRRTGERSLHPLVRTGNIASMLAFLCLLAGFGTFLSLVIGTVLPG
jgi:hypothetical protein